MWRERVGLEGGHGACITVPSVSKGMPVPREVSRDDR
jgi:hypothetical protein